MPVMSTNKPNRDKAAAYQKLLDRFSRPMGYRPPAEISAALAQYCAGYEFAPPTSKIITAALVEFFATRGIEVNVPDEE